MYSKPSTRARCSAPGCVRPIPESRCSHALVEPFRQSSPARPSHRPPPSSRLPPPTWTSRAGINQVERELQEGEAPDSVRAEWGEGHRMWRAFHRGSVGCGSRPVRRTGACRAAVMPAGREPGPVPRRPPPRSASYGGLQDQDCSQGRRLRRRSPPRLRPARPRGRGPRTGRVRRCPRLPGAPGHGTVI